MGIMKKLFGVKKPEKGIKKDEGNNVPFDSEQSDFRDMDWPTVLGNMKRETKMESVHTMRRFYSLARKTYPCLDSFFLTMREDFYSINEQITSKEDVSHILKILSDICVRFNAGFHALKDEAIKRYCSALNDEDLVHVYMAIEYYCESLNGSKEGLSKALGLIEDVCRERFDGQK